MLLLFSLCQTGCATDDPIAHELKQLQGHWEGQELQGKTSITIADDSLYFYRRSDLWYKATFVLPAITDPRQLHATITDSAPPKRDIGYEIIAIYKIEDGMLTLATDGGSDSLPQSFAVAANRYELRKAK